MLGFNRDLRTGTHSTDHRKRILHKLSLSRRHGMVASR